jgi:putative Ca2+/H+ antiporter (TMEM165/GDT1 family)
MSAEEKEMTFYSDARGVRITSARLIVGDTTYAMANIASVETKRVSPGYGRVALLVILGMFFVIGSTPSAIGKGSPADLILGVLFVAGGVWLAITQKPNYQLRITSASGESSPLASKERAYVEKIVQAINESMIHRG